MIKKYYDKECSKEELVEENRKLLEDYRNLEVIINKELKINK